MHARNAPLRPRGHIPGGFRQVSLDQVLPDASLVAFAVAIDRLNSTQAVSPPAQVATISTVTAAIRRLSSIQAVADATLTASLSVVSASGSLSTNFTLTSNVTSAAVPFTVGHAFKQGDVPAGSGILVSGANAQVTVKNTWPDGSAKFAIVAGTASLAAGTPAAVALTSGAASSGTALTTFDLKAALTQPVTIGAGAYGSASWSGTDWDAPFQTWITGHRMSSWVYRKPVGSDAHLVAWLEVRLYAGGAVEVLPWIENGYLKVASPTSKSATYTFTLGGTQRFSQSIDLPNHCRSVLLSGSAPSHWLGTDPDITVKHDAAYLMSTEMVPTYSASVSAASSMVTGLVSSFAPLQQGNYFEPMDNVGYQPTLGLLPQWDVLYLTSTSAAPWKALQFNAYSAGRYGIHFRDENTNLPIKFSDRPLLVVSQASPADNIRDRGQSATNDYTIGSAGPTYPALYDEAHHPSMGYFAYLVTGRYYFLEECQFVATTNYLKNDTDKRIQGQGVFLPDAGANTTRGAAWALRTLFQAAAISPDGSALKSEFVASAVANINYFHAKHVAQLSCPQGWVTPYYTNGSVEAPWQQDFFTAAVGYGLCLNVLDVTASAKAREFFEYKSQSIVGRLGGANSKEWGYSDAAAYEITVTPTSTPDWTGGTGPWFSDWGAVYANFYGVTNPSTAPGLRGGNFPDGSSYWGNLQPAIAYAVRHGCAGAIEAWGRMTGDANWSQLANDFNTRGPEWSVKPPSAYTTAPAWLPASGQVASASTNTIDAVKTTDTDNISQIFAAWSGMAWAPWAGSLGQISVMGGGHGDRRSNAEYLLDLASRAWIKEKQESPIFLVNNECASTTTGWLWADNSGSTQQGGQTFTSHFYSYRLCLPPSALPGQGATQGWVYLPGHAGMPNSGQVGTTQAHKRRLGVDTSWTFHGSPGSTTPHHCASAYDPKRRRVWYTSGDNPVATLWYRDLATGAESSIALSGQVSGYYSNYFVDELWDCLIAVNSTQGGFYLKVVDLSTGTVYTPTTSGSQPSMSGADAWCWSPKFRALCGTPGDGTAKAMFLKAPDDPRTNGWVWSAQNLSGSVTARDDVTPSYNRIAHATKLGNVLIWVPSYNHAVQAFGVTPP